MGKPRASVPNNPVSKGEVYGSISLEYIKKHRMSLVTYAKVCSWSATLELGIFANASGSMKGKIYASPY
jgi:hypothetical protein